MTYTLQGQIVTAVDEVFDTLEEAMAAAQRRMNDNGSSYVVVVGPGITANIYPAPVEVTA